MDKKGVEVSVYIELSLMIVTPGKHEDCFIQNPGTSPSSPRKRYTKAWLWIHPFSSRERGQSYILKGAQDAKINFKKLTSNCLQ